MSHCAVWRNDGDTTTTSGFDPASVDQQNASRFISKTESRWTVTVVQKPSQNIVYPVLRLSIKLYDCFRHAFYYKISKDQRI